MSAEDKDIFRLRILPLMNLPEESRDRRMKAYRSGIAHQDGRWNSLHYPYPSYSIRHPLFPLADAGTTKSQVRKADDAVDQHEDHSLDLALSSTTADGNVRRSCKETSPPISESESRVGIMAVDNDDERMKRVEDFGPVLGNLSNPTNFDPNNFVDWEFVSPNVFCQRSWKDMVVQGTGCRGYLRPPYQPRQLIDIWEAVDMFPASNHSFYSSNRSASALFARTTSSRLRGAAEPPALSRPGGDWIEVDGLGQELKSLNFAGWFRPDRNSWNDTLDPLLLTAGNLVGVETDPTSIEAEHIQTVHELSEIQELQRLNAKNVPDKNAMRELAILKARESRLLHRLQDFQRELESVEEDDDMQPHGFYNENIESGRYIKSEASFAHNILSFSFFESTSTDTSKRYSMLVHDAKNQLDVYNKKWEDIKSSSSGSTGPSFPPQIPWPIISPNFTRDSLAMPVGSHHGRNNSYDKQENMKWRAFAFLCHGFGLQPMWYGSQDSSDDFSFTFPIEDSSNDKRRKLKGLRSQLKLEKVRWHEDKLRALFGPGVAKDEKAKAVWNAVMNLKWRVDKELEKVGI